MKRQQIIDALINRLKGISTTNGFNTDIGQSVHEWRKIPFEDNELPALNVMDLENRKIDFTNLEVKHQLTVQVDIVEDGNLLKQTVRKIIADVLKAIGQDETLGGLVEYIQYENDFFQVEQKDKEMGVCSLTFSIFYYTQRWEI